MRSIVAMLLAGLTAWSHAADAEEVRLDFKGLALGSTESQLKAHTPVTCGPDPTGEFDQQCFVRDRANRSYAGVPARQVKFGLFAGRLDTVVVHLDSREYEHLKYAMDDKFGAVTPSLDLSERSTYRMNGDRAYLYRTDKGTVVRYEAAAGKDERERRFDAVKGTVRKDM
jgi:hypothetical protein